MGEKSGWPRLSRDECATKQVTMMSEINEVRLMDLVFEQQPMTQYYIKIIQGELCDFSGEPGLCNHPE